MATSTSWTLLLLLLFCCLLHHHHVSGASVQMILDPASLTIPDGESAIVTLSFNVTVGELPKESRIVITNDHPHVSDLDQQDIFVQDLSRSVNLTITGKLIGRSKLTFKFYEKPGNKSKSIQVLDVAVVRAIELAQLVFTIFVTILVSINNISMGCVISLATIAAVVKKPIAPLIGFACQFLIMPLGSYFIGAYFFPDDVNFRLGLFVLGCCPGGTGSNFWTLLFDGDVDLSITMTFFSTIAAMGMMPLWIFTLGREMLREANVQIPYLNLTVSLVSLTLTLGIGLAIQKYKPTLAAFLKKIMKPMTAVIMTIVIIGASFMSLYIIPHMTWRIVIAGLSCAMSGYVLGAVVAALFNLNRSQIVAVSIETALQNPGVAFVLLTLSLKQPDSDLAAIPVVAQLFMTGIPMWITYLFYFTIKTLKRRIRKRKNAKERNNRRPTVIVKENDAGRKEQLENETEKLPV